MFSVVNTAENCIRYHVTIFDIATGERLGEGTNTTKRILFDFDPTDTTGPYVMRVDAICSNRKVALDMFDVSDINGNVLTFTVNLISVDDSK